MKKFVLSFAVALLCSVGAYAQKYAFIDTEYILKNIPQYESANQQLEQSSKKWQKEIEALNNEAQTLYKNYQAEMVFLTDEQKQEKEKEIVAKETEASELKRKYFGNDGELFKKKESLMKPIYEELYNGLKGIAESKGYAAIWDRATGMIMFVNPKIDISDDLLNNLGYAK
ncbi:MAG: OmpH family outer membrane protein [Paludibacteraceae bacterium]|nr:OmpH family outer membrane protein [Paludibacteraceae bacterium]